MKMGLYGNSEGEFLQFCDTAMTKPTAVAATATNTGKEYVNAKAHQAHHLVGVSPSGLLANDPRYPLSNMSWHTDPRFSRLLAATSRLSSSRSSSAGTSDGVLVTEDDESDTLVNRIHKRVARFLYVSAEDIDVRQPISHYGLDSLVAAEVRNWLYGAFGVQVGSLTLLRPDMSVVKLAGEVEGGVKGKEGGE